MAGGGGAVDHARHQRERNVHGSSQARTRRRVTGQVTTMHALAVAESVPMPPPLLLVLLLVLLLKPAVGRIPSTSIPQCLVFGGK